MKGWIIVGALLAGAGYVGYLEERASAGAEDFCRQAVVGAPIASVAEAASSAGGPYLRRIKDDEVQVGFTGLPPFSRHLCVVEAEKAVVRDARVQRLD